VKRFDRLPGIVALAHADRAMDLGARRPLAVALAQWTGNSLDHGELVARLALAARLQRV
jgi:hypothetical protein